MGATLESKIWDILDDSEFDFRTMWNRALLIWAKEKKTFVWVELIFIPL